MTVFKCFCLAALLAMFTFASGSVLNAAPLDIKAKVEQMRKDKKISEIGWSEDAGVYVIVFVSVSLTSQLTPDEANELALAKAKKEIASTLGESMSAHTESNTTQTVAEGKVEGNDSYASLKKIDTAQFLRGVALYDTRTDGRVLQAVCFASGKSMDLAQELQAKMAELQPGTVGAVGVAVIVDGRLDQAKAQALAMALRQAVEQVLGTAVAATTQVQDSTKVRAKIFSHAAGFVDEYRITEEGQVGGNYRIALIAKVSKDKLLDSYKAYMKSFGDPQFYVRTNSKELYQTYVKFFSELGLKLVDNETKADYIIDAWGDFRKLKHPASGIEGTQLSLWIRIFDAKSEQELLSQKNDPTKSAVFYSTGDRQADIASEKAFAQLKAPLHEAINKMIGGMADSGRNIQIVIDNYSDVYNQSLDSIGRAIEMVPGCSNVNKKIDTSARMVTFTANYQAKMDDLEFFLRNHMNKDLSNTPQLIPKTTAIETNKLSLSF